MNHTVLLYYKYTYISDPQALVDAQRALCQSLGLKGRILIAHEGINGTVEGLTENTEKYIEIMKQDPRFNDVHWKKSVGTGNSFPKLKVKVRTEIVSAHLGEDDVNPEVMTGKRLSPHELQEWYKNKEEFTVIDMRNRYEYELGRFEGSIDPGMDNFRDLPEVTKKLESLKEKKVLTVCTGGVRCEKASGYLVKKGFKDVYQLDGGIVSYMEQFPGQEFKGKLYVFDNRLAMDFDSPDNHTVVSTCRKCNGTCEQYVNCKNKGCNLHFICCDNCREEDGRPFCSEACKEKACAVLVK